MSDYKTIEGHEIIAGECYQTRSGKKLFVCELPQPPSAPQIGGVVLGSFGVFNWANDGRLYPKIESEYDIMRPWPPTTKQEARDAD